MAKHKIALIPGDGIGKEVLPEGVRVLEAAARRFNFQLEFTDFDWSCDRLLKTGKMMPEDGMEQLKAFESIFLGAVGWPGVPDHVSLWGLLIPIRRDFDEYVNLRPVRLFEGVPSPLANRKPGDIDFWVVRENTEGEYSQLGGRMFQGTENEMAVQETVFTRKGVDRVMKFAFEFASKGKKKHVTSATKSNGIIHTMPFWDERFAEMKKNYPGIKADQYHIDILTAHFVRNPDWFDVVVGSNLFGDILSELGPALTGSIGVAPDIAGKWIANPIGQIWSGAMMVRHLGYPEAAEAIERAIAASLVEGGPRTKDLGGNGDTKTVGTAIAELVKTV
jgi:tartrate dehydrogenase/decarboxylase/D-malate dehydrogenase